MKKCSKCQEQKPLTEFARSNSHKSGYQSYCKSCRRLYWAENRDRLNANRNASATRRGVAESKKAYMDEYRAANKDRLRSSDRARYVLRHYGLTVDAYDALLSSGCALCGSMERLHVDHNHACCPGKITCGKCIRGALCRTHNIGLGMFDDDPTVLRRAAEYIEWSQR